MPLFSSSYLEISTLVSLSLHKWIGGGTHGQDDSYGPKLFEIDIIGMLMLSTGSIVFDVFAFILD